MEKEQNLYASVCVCHGENLCRIQKTKKKKQRKSDEPYDKNQLNKKKIYKIYIFFLINLLMVLITIITIKKQQSLIIISLLTLIIKKPQDF